MGCSPICLSELQRMTPHRGPKCREGSGRLFRSARKQPGCLIFITSNFGGDLDNEYLVAAQDPQKFADSVLAYLKAYDLDGYDMDWESGQITIMPRTDLASLDLPCHVCGSRKQPAGQTLPADPYGLARGRIGTDGCRVKGQRGSDQHNVLWDRDKVDLVLYADAYARPAFLTGR